MKASYNWLKELVLGLPAPRELAERFTSAGVEVEAVREYGAGTESCVLAWVVSTRPHPSKSGLRLVTVDHGHGTQEVICGAPNVPDPGGVVVLAPLGTHLPAKNMTIGKRDIGGVTSEGMLCSESELGLSEDGEGILVFPPGFAAPGTKLTDAIPEVRDAIFEVGLTANRPDGLGHIGLAREAAAILGIPWKRPAPSAPTRTSSEKTAGAVAISIEAKDRCAHYAGALVTGVTVGPSPAGARYRLAALGVRAISNAVDVTNLVMLEYGHPMHAFDLDKVRGGKIVVRLAVEGEKLETLDGVTRTLVADDLVIADAEGPIALAGVMGGASTEISPTTKRVLLECAVFDPRSVRRTARRHGLHSESSHRFERGVDHGDTKDCILHASSLTADFCGGSAASEPAIAEGTPWPPVAVSLRAGAPARVLGVDVPLAESKALLVRLGLTVKSERPDAIDFQIPTHRPDLTREIDLVEEVARVRGIDKIAAVLPAVHPTKPVGGREALLRRVRGVAVSLGLSEAMTFGFTSSRTLAALHAPPPAVTLQNPLTEELDVMRTSLFSGLLEALVRAQRHGQRDVSMFTTGVVFLAGDGAAALPEERPMFAAVLAGERTGYLERPRAVDVFDATGLAEEIVHRLAGETPKLTATPNGHAAHLHPRGAASVELHHTRVGSLGPLHPDVADALQLDLPVALVELDLSALSALGVTTPRFAPIARFPPVTRDAAIVVRTTVPVGDVLALAKASAGPLAEDVRLFDRFTGGSIPEGHASLAMRVVYRSPDRTLKDEEVDVAHARVVSALAERFGATLRA